MTFSMIYIYTYYYDDAQRYRWEIRRETRAISFPARESRIHCTVHVSVAGFQVKKWAYCLRLLHCFVR